MKIVPVITILVCLVSCSTTKTVTKEVQVLDSTSRKEVERLRLDSASIVNRYELALKKASESGVVFREPCDTIIFPSYFNADSAVKVINALKSTVRYYKDGSYEVTGKLSSLNTANSEIRNQLDVTEEKFISLQREYSDSMNYYHKTTSTSIIKKKGGFSLKWLLWGLLIGGLIVGFGRPLLTYVKKRVPLRIAGRPQFFKKH